MTSMPGIAALSDRLRRRLCTNGFAQTALHRLSGIPSLWAAQTIALRVLLSIVRGRLTLDTLTAADAGVHLRAPKKKAAHQVPGS